MIVEESAYIAPHRHPVTEDFVVHGRVDLILFDDRSNIVNIIELRQPHAQHFDIPAGTYHAFIVRERSAACSREPLGHDLAPWAPRTLECLKRWVNTHLGG